MCFTLYDEDVHNKSGKEWVMYGCSRWLHEKCVEDCVLDSTGKVRLCPLCLDISAIIIIFMINFLSTFFPKNIINLLCCSALCTWGYSILSAVAAIEST